MPPAGLPPSGFSLDLAHAVVLASDTPTLLLGADTTVLAASHSFLLSFGLDSEQVTSTKLSLLGHGEWDVPQLEGLLLATASGFAAVKNYEMDLRRPDHPVQHLQASAQKLQSSEHSEPMVLLSISDVTEGRIRDRQTDLLVREKEVLLEELQHRIANSLQIIASVILQSARTAKSEEARLGINDAHYRVMSVAALQQQLAASRLEEVDLQPYLISLCRSLGASMIRDRSKLAIHVDVPAVLIKANVSLSLGLIVTELVINALKHAFPGGRSGTISVGYTVAASRWTLTVADDGVGMLAETATVKAGLGSSIITALAAQLGAKIEITDALPGTLVRISGDVAGPSDEQAAI